MSCYGVGRPEFIVTSDECPEFVMVVECKADPKKHSSSEKNKPADYAIDGALWYASFLAKEFDVLAIGVSGQTESEYRISQHLILRGTSKPVTYNPPKDIISFSAYYQSLLDNELKLEQDFRWPRSSAAAT